MIADDIKNLKIRYGVAKPLSEKSAALVERTARRSAISNLPNWLIVLTKWAAIMQ